jgi:hypothetical protein
MSPTRSAPRAIGADGPGDRTVWGELPAVAIRSFAGAPGELRADGPHRDGSERVARIACSAWRDEFPAPTGARASSRRVAWGATEADDRDARSGPVRCPKRGLGVQRRDRAAAGRGVHPVTSRAVGMIVGRQRTMPAALESGFAAPHQDRDNDASEAAGDVRARSARRPATRRLDQSLTLSTEFPGVR